MPNESMPRTGAEAVGRTADFTNLGSEKQQTQAEVRTADRMASYSGMNEVRFQDYLHEVEHTQKAWTKEEITERSGETSRFKRVAATITEIVVPIATGTAVDTLIKTAGVAGGPLVSAAVGAASGAARAAMEYRHVGKEGQNAAEFWQKNVGSKDKKADEGNLLQRGWGVVSRIMKGGSYLAVEAGFKVKERDERIQEFMHDINLETNENGSALKNPNTVLQKLERKFESNPEEFKTFVKDLMVQSVLSNFSEQKTTAEQKQMSDVFCIANALLYNADAERLSQQYHSLANARSAHHEPTETINQLWEESKEEVKMTVAKTQAYFIIGSATERAIKSVVGFYAVKWVADGISHLTELQPRIVDTDQVKNANSLVDKTNNDIRNTNQNITNLQDKINHLKIDQTPTQSNIEVSSAQTVDYKSILEPAAHASGQDIDTYLAMGERSDRIKSIPEVIKTLQDQNALNHIAEISKNTGLKPEEVLNSEILRWGYDNKTYASFGEMLQKAADNDPRAIASLREAYNASKNVNPSWTELAKKILDNAQTTSTPTFQVNNNLEQLQTLQDQLLAQQNTLKALNLAKEQTQHVISELKNSAAFETLKNSSNDIWEVSKRGILASSGALVDVLTNSQSGTYMYGEKNRFRRRPRSNTQNNQQTNNTGPQPGANTQNNQQTNNTGPQPGANAQNNQQRTNANTGPQAGQTATTAEYFGFDPAAADEVEKNAYKFVNFQEGLNRDIKSKLARGQHLSTEDITNIREWLNNENMLTDWNTIYRRIMNKVSPRTNTTPDARRIEFIMFMNNFNDEVFKRYQRRQRQTP